MLLNYLKNIFNRPARTLINRCFNPGLLKDKQQQVFFNKNGFVHLKNILTPEEINKLLKLYNESRELPGFENTDYYINSIGFKDTSIRKHLKTETEKILLPVLDRFINASIAEFPLGGGFCINPPNSTRGCSPHQDPTCVDELHAYSMTTWITLTDMTPENGCMHIIPGSHLWGNTQRSVCVPWAFEMHSDYLWKYLKAVPTKAGDVLCFDVSTIHASGKNSTDIPRLAITVQTIPKQFELISYYPAEHNRLDVYAIDTDYFIKESQYEKPSSNYLIISNQPKRQSFTRKDIDQLNQEFTQQNNL